MKLDRHQTRQLKAMAHALKPVVRVGQNGLTEAVFVEINRALDDHELIKIKLPGSRQERTDAIDNICVSTAADPVALTGGVAIIFRRNIRKPKISI